MNANSAQLRRPGRPGGGRSGFASVVRTRLGALWVAMIASALALLLLLIFALQNGQAVRVSFLGAHASMPLGIALLLAALGGVLVVALPGSGRILQLRRLARRSQGRRPLQPDPAIPQVPSADQPQAAVPAGHAPGVPDAARLNGLSGPRPPSSPGAGTSSARS